jgi:hypothetical protein
MPGLSLLLHLCPVVIMLCLKPFPFRCAVGLTACPACLCCPISTCRLVQLVVPQAEAALPPPFPSNAPLRAYISNMAVAPSARRQGLGRTLCTACGRVAKAWGEPCVLLHVAADNATAQQLYASCGFVPVSNSQGFSGLIKGPWTQQRMAVESGQLAAGYRRLPGGAGGSAAVAAAASRWQQIQA